MAVVSSTFVARFESFFDQVSKASAKLEDLNMDGEKVQASLNRIGKAYSGDKLIQDATLTAKAIEDIGGAAILTDKEAAKVNRTMTEAIEKMMRLGVEVPPEIQKMADATKQAGKETEQFRGEADKSASSTMTLADRVTAVSQAFSQAQSAIRSVWSTLGDWLESANESELSGRRLAASLEAAGVKAPGVVRAYLDLASAYQRVTIYSDEMLASAADILTTIGGVMPAQMDKALRATTNLAAGLGVDLETAARMVSKGIDGNITALQKQGVQLDSTRAKVEGASYVLDAISDKFRGRASADAASFSGQLKILENQVDDAKEELGQLIGSGLAPVLDMFRSLSPETQQFITQATLIAGAVGTATVAVAALTAAFTLAAPAVTGMAVSLAALALNPVVLAVAAITAGVVALGVAARSTTNDLARQSRALEDQAVIYQALHGGLESGKITMDAYRAAVQRTAEARFIDKQQAAEYTKANTDLSRAFDGLSLNVDEYGSRLKAARVEANKIKDAHGDEIKAALALGVSMEDIAKKYGMSSDAARVYGNFTKEVEKVDNKAADAKRKHGEELDKLANKYASSGLSDQEKLLVEYLTQGVTVSRMSSDAQKMLAKDVEDLVSHYKSLGVEVPKSVQAVYDSTKDLVTIPEMVKNALSRANDEARKLQDDMLKQSIKNGIEQTNAALKNNKNALDSAVDVTRQMADLFATPYERAVLKADEWARAQMKAIAPLEKSMPEVFQKARAAIVVVHDQMIADAQAAAKKTAGFWSKTFSELPASILDAVKGGGNVGETVGTVLANDLFADGGPMNKLLTSGANKLGNKIGGNLGANLANGMINMIPGIGAMIGPALGEMLNKVGGAVAGWFGAVSKEVKAARGDINELETSLAASLTAAQKAEAGGVGWKMTTIAVRDAYLSVGRTAAEAEAIVKQLWNDKDPKASKAAIEEINKVLAESKEKYKAITEEIKTLEAEMETLRAQSNPTFKDMEDAANKFGVNLASLGPKFQQSKINEQAKEIIDGFETLKRGGADVNAVLNGMADEISKVVNDSIKFKTTIPENMRPMIESLIQNGQLIDENGEKITDMSNIRFGEPIADKFTVIADRMKEVGDMLKDLIEKLGNGFKNAAEQAKAAADANLGNLSYDVPVNLHYNHDNQSGGEGEDARGYASGTKGMTGAWFKNFGVGTRTVLHGDEAVVRRDQAGDFAAAFGAGGDSGTVAELRALRSDMAAMPTHIARAVRDAVLVAG